MTDHPADQETQSERQTVQLVLLVITTCLTPFQPSAYRVTILTPNAVSGQSRTLVSFLLHRSSRHKRCYKHIANYNIVFRLEVKLRQTVLYLGGDSSCRGPELTFNN